jgi:SAM-dependent methyltransferase
MLLHKALDLLRLPETSFKDLDSSENIYVIRKIIQRKPFLRKIYESFYLELLNKCADAPSKGYIVELGSGASFIKRFCSSAITSDVLPYDGVDMVFSALDIPFQEGSVSAFLMIDVLHHIKDSRIFFREMHRCLNVGGKIVMIEPANTPWASFIYKRFHHEPFDPDGEWGFEQGGPLTGANMAIPWIIFCRDSAIFAKEFSCFNVQSIRIHTPLRYLLSGGLSLRQLLPSPLYPLIYSVELLLLPFNKHIGMFMTIELEKIS